MTKEEILALSDAELVARIAERAMGQEEWYVEKWIAITRWSPLTDWNHCQMVAEAMRAKGFRRCVADCSDEGDAAGEVRVWFSLRPGSAVSARRGDEIGERRAHIQAALIAVESK